MTEKRQLSFVMTSAGVTWLSVGVNAVLALAKLVVGFLCGAQTLIADGFHSGSDLATDAAVLAGLKASARPADRTHHYGHLRISTLVAMFIGSALGAAAAYIFYEAVYTFHRIVHAHPLPPMRADLPFWVALASVPTKEFMYRLTLHVGRKAHDISVVANAWHHRTDAFTSIAAAIGLAGVMIGGPTWRFLDPLTATVLAALLLAWAVNIIGEAASELIDRAPAAGALRSIEQAVARTRGVRSYHGFRARKLGGKVEMDIHIQVEPSLTVEQGHDIATAVRDSVQRADPSVVQVIVHVEPALKEYVEGSKPGVAED